ncbi:MAG: hypothetical protein AAB869_02865 [Patescibacteria group bacterium]
MEGIRDFELRSMGEYTVAYFPKNGMGTRRLTSTVCHLVLRIVVVHSQVNTMPIIRLFSSFLISVFLLAGCDTMSIIQQITTPPEILPMIQPTRTLKIFVAYDNPESLEQIKKSLEEASTVLKKTDRG